MPGSLRIERDEPIEGVVELHVHGDVDLGGGKRLEHQIDAIVEAGGRVVVNLEKCTFLDSSGLSALIRMSRHADGVGRFAVVCPENGTVRHLFSLTRAHTLLDLHADRASALAAVA